MFLFLTYYLCVLDGSEQTVMAGRSDIVDTRSCGTYHRNKLSLKTLDIVFWGDSVTRNGILRGGLFVPCWIGESIFPVLVWHEWASSQIFIFCRTVPLNAWYVKMSRKFIQSLLGKKCFANWFYYSIIWMINGFVDLRGVGCTHEDPPPLFYCNNFIWRGIQIASKVVMNFCLNNDHLSEQRPSDRHDGQINPSGA